MRDAVDFIRARRVRRAVDLAHSALANCRSDFVDAETGARGRANGERLYGPDRRAERTTVHQRRATWQVFPPHVGFVLLRIDLVDGQLRLFRGRRGRCASMN